jgi:hypothetical protein
VGDFQHLAITERIADHLRRGELLDLAPDLVLESPVDEVSMTFWDGAHSVAADDLRDLLCGRVVVDPDPRGLRLRAVRICGRLDLDNLATTIKLVLLDCLLDEGITAVAAHLPGLSLQRCLLTHPSKPALCADELRTDAGVSFEGSTIRACTADGAMRVNGARIGGQLDCSGATISNPSGPALHGERLHVDGDVLLRAGFTADGASELSEARIGGKLDCSGATMTNLSGPALHGANLQVSGNVFLRAGFTADGAGEWGAVRLSGARIGGQLDCSGATITNPSGPALRAGALQVARSALLRAGFTANGAGDWGAVRLSGARIGGQLDCSSATITNPSGPALLADTLQASSVFLRAGFTANGAGERGTVRLSEARVGGQLDCSGAVVTSRSNPQHRWSLDGLTYIGVPLDPIGTGRTGWLHLFRTATPTYAAQPYQQLASVYRAAGHDRDVSQILIAQRQAQLDRGVLTGREWLWTRITGITLGYGYQPWRVLLLLLGVVVTSVVLTLALGARGALAHPLDPKNPTAATIPCAVTEQVGVGLDIGGPFLDTHARDRCTTTDTATGIGLAYSTLGLQLLAGVLAALFIAGVTGIVRKT